MVIFKQYFGLKIGLKVVKSEAELKAKSDLKVLTYGQIVAFFHIVSCICQYPRLDTGLIPFILFIWSDIYP